VRGMLGSVDDECEMDNSTGKAIAAVLRMPGPVQHAALSEHGTTGRTAFSSSSVVIIDADVGARRAALITAVARAPAFAFAELHGNQ